jgi:hypothetical protein
MIEAIDAAGRSPIRNLSDFHTMFDKVNKTSFYAGRMYAQCGPLYSAGLKILPPESQFFTGE